MTSTKSPAPKLTIAVLIFALVVLSVIAWQYYYVFWPPDAAPLRVTQIACLTDSTGKRVNSAKFKNTGDSQLDEVHITFSFKCEDAKDVVITRYWQAWAPGEQREIPLVSTISIQKISMVGTCKQGRLEDTWLPKATVHSHTFDPKSSLTGFEQGRLEALDSILEPEWPAMETIIARQTATVKKLQEALSVQYQELEARRSKLESGEVERFNEDAADYARRLQELRNQEAFLKGLIQPPSRQSPAIEPPIQRAS